VVVGSEVGGAAGRDWRVAEMTTTMPGAACHVRYLYPSLAHLGGVASGGTGTRCQMPGMSPNARAARDVSVYEKGNKSRYGVASKDKTEK
jgi:hypothetical protein